MQPPLAWISGFALPLVVAMTVTSPDPRGGGPAPRDLAGGDAGCTAPPSPTAGPVPLSTDELKRAGATIDRLVDEDLAAHGLKPNAPIDDARFLRRAWLAIAGRIPTVEEAKEFLDNRDPRRRDKLVERLVGSPAWASREFTWWADLLRVNTRLGDRYPGQAYVDWIKESVKTGKPYDQMVRELLTASGPALARGNGATGYYLRDAGMPLDNMSNTVQVFLGTRLACAQCHDHPFDKWTRKDYFALAAFTAAVNVRRDIPGGGGGMMKKTQEQPPEVKNALRIIGNSLVLKVDGGPGENAKKDPAKPASIVLPVDYQYHDAKPGDRIEATTIFGGPVPTGKDLTPRQAYAAWLTTPANPRFTTVIANRQWKKVFGLGLIEPVDNFTDQTQATNPKLLAHLERILVTVKYDLRAFQRILYQTKAWQRQTNVTDLITGEPYRFPGPVLRRLGAEQVWDSLITLAVPEVDSRQGEGCEPLYQWYEANKDKDATALFAMAQEWGGLREEGLRLRQEAEDLREQLRALPNKTGDAAKALRQKLQDIEPKRDALFAKTEPARMLAKKPQKDGRNNLLRASELPSPAPADHFLRTFGQSDRDLIDSGHTEAAVTQALTLLNGFVDRELLREKTPLFNAVLAARDADGRIDALWQAILTRPPTPAEKNRARAVMLDALITSRKSGAPGDPNIDATRALIRDLGWVLVNTNEFLFTP